VLDVGADDSGGVLGAEGERLRFALAGGTTAVLPRVHLFRDDIGLFTDGTREEARLLEDGGTYLANVVETEDFAGDGLDVVPKVSLGRKQIAGAAYGFDG